MKLHTLTFAMAASVVVLTGCVSPNGEPDNTGSGALIGAGTGALIGGANGGGGGALIGAAVGAIAGGLIGHTIDQDQQMRLREQAPQTYVRVDQGQPLSVVDVKALARAGISEDIIISQIRSSRTVFHLSAADIIDLRDAGVSNKVVDFMINTPSAIGGTSEVTPQATVVTTDPPPVPVETVVAAPGPEYVWLGGEWAWNGGWIWVGGHWGYPPYPHAVWVSGRWDRGPRGWHRAPGHWR
jgi:hypothetical protein